VPLEIATLFKNRDCSSAQYGQPKRRITQDKATVVALTAESWDLLPRWVERIAYRD